MKTAVDKVGRGKQRQVNARFRAMVSHFLFEAEFCNPAAGWEPLRLEAQLILHSLDHGPGRGQAADTHEEDHQQKNDRQQAR